MELINNNVSSTCKYNTNKYPYYFGDSSPITHNTFTISPQCHDIRQCNYVEDNGYGYFYDIEENTDTSNHIVRIMMIEDEEPESTSTFVQLYNCQSCGGDEILNTIISISMITTIIIYILIII